MPWIERRSLELSFFFSKRNNKVVESHDAPVVVASSPLHCNRDGRLLYIHITRNASRVAGVSCHRARVFIDHDGPR